VGPRGAPELGGVQGSPPPKQWRDGRAVEGGGLENRCTRKGTGGSNPPPSARARSRLSAIAYRELWARFPALTVPGLYHWGTAYPNALSINCLRGTCPMA
jgi:hypothetical protein